jgi:hypothetical protein
LNSLTEHERKRIMSVTKSNPTNPRSKSTTRNPKPLASGGKGNETGDDPIEARRELAREYLLAMITPEGVEGMAIVREAEALAERMQWFVDRAKKAGWIDRPEPSQWPIESCLQSASYVLGHVAEILVAAGCRDLLCDHMAQLVESIAGAGEAKVA